VFGRRSVQPGCIGALHKQATSDICRHLYLDNRRVRVSLISSSRLTKDLRPCAFHARSRWFGPGGKEERSGEGEGRREVLLGRDVNHRELGLSDNSRELEFGSGDITMLLLSSAQFGSSMSWSASQSQTLSSKAEAPSFRCIIRLPTLHPLFVPDVEGGHSLEVSFVPSAPPRRTWLSVMRECQLSASPASPRARHASDACG